MLLIRSSSVIGGVPYNDIVLIFGDIGIAALTHTPSTLAYVLATKSPLAPLGKGDLGDRGCAHTDRDLMTIIL